MNLQTKRFQAAIDRINQNIAAARIVSDLSKVEFYQNEEPTRYKYEFSNKSNSVYFGLGILFDPYPQFKKPEEYAKYQVEEIHRIGGVPDVLLKKGEYHGDIWLSSDTGREENKWKQFLSLYFNGNGVATGIGGSMKETRSKASPLVSELSELMHKGDNNKSNHADVLRAIDLSFRLLTFPDRDAIDLIGEIG